MFVATYLLGEAPKATAQMIYDRYTVLGGDPTHIRGQSSLHVHAAEYFGGVPVDHKEVEVGDHGGGHDEVPVCVQEEMASDPPTDAQVDNRTEASVEGIGDTHEQRTASDSLGPWGAFYRV